MTRLAKVRTRQPKSKLVPQSTPLTSFARELLREWRQLDLRRADARIIVAVSGGADSAALLFALDELIKARKLKISPVVAHLNHKLRGKASDADARWVRSVSRQLGYSFETSAINVKKRAVKFSDNLEQAARRARYTFLLKVARINKARIVLTAHTMDDQVETFLLNMIRGSGAEGLTGIDLTRPLEANINIELVRPLLSWATRQDTEAYCRARSIDFRVDEMNADETLNRVRVRRQLVPLLRTFNPKFIERLTRSIEILREDHSALDAAAARLLELSSAHGRESHRDDTSTTLPADLLRMAPPALRRRALRMWIARVRGDLRRIESAHIIAIEKLLTSSKSGRLVELPGGATISRGKGRLAFHKAKQKR